MLWGGVDATEALELLEEELKELLLEEDDLLLLPLPPSPLPWQEPQGRERQVKAPKIYIKDSGILHHLLGIHAQIETHPKCGASWESFAIHQILAHFALEREDVYFWRTQAGAELDLLVMRGERRVGFEIKYTSTPKVTPSIASALRDLSLEKVLIVIPGNDAYRLHGNIHVIGLDSLPSVEL